MKHNKSYYKGKSHLWNFLFFPKGINQPIDDDDVYNCHWKGDADANYCIFIVIHLFSLRILFVEWGFDYHLRTFHLISQEFCICVLIQSSDFRLQTPYPRNPHPSVNKHSAWWLTLFVSWPPDCAPLCFANSKFESSCSVSTSLSFSSNFSFLCRYLFAWGVGGGGNGIRVGVSFFFRYRFDLRSSLKSKIDWFARFVSLMQQMETSTDKTP